MKILITRGGIRLMPLRKAAAVALLGLAAAGFVASEAAADVVTDWNAKTTAILALPPGTLLVTDERPTFLHWALVQIAVYDAVNAIDGSYSVFAVNPHTNGRGASQEAAAVSAAYNVLINVFPSRKTVTLDADYAASLLAIPNGPAKVRGIAIGREVAGKLLAKRANDGRNATVPYGFGSGPGVYQVTPGAPPTAPITPWMAQVTPFVMASPSQFRGEGPRPLTSAIYAADLNETKQMGQLGSIYRTAAQTEIGKFHTMNPILFWGNNLNKFVLAQGLEVAENARLMAQLFVAHADAGIACWDGKFHFNRWRPVTAIRNADTDDNLATISQADWAPQEITPPHQEYPAAHGCVSAAIMESLRHYFGTPYLQLSFISTASGTTHNFTNTRDFLREIEDARVFGGMHLRSSVEDGEDIGAKVARLIAAQKFKPVFRGRAYYQH